MAPSSVVEKPCPNPLRHHIEQLDQGIVLQGKQKDLAMYWTKEAVTEVTHRSPRPDAATTAEIEDLLNQVLTRLGA